MRHPVYLVRHGQSEWNVRRLTQGQTVHPPLTTLGREQAGAAAELIADDLDRLGLTAGRVLSSDLTRAVQSAQVIARRLGRVPATDPRLREQHLGRLEGLSYEETWAVAEALDWNDPEAPVEGGESAMAVRRRMVDLFAALDPGQVHVLVSHGDSIRLLLGHLHGHAPHEAPWVEVPNGAVLRVDDTASWLSGATEERSLRPTLAP